jgi:predicted MFS family arabinose efflux permease
MHPFRTRHSTAAVARSAYWGGVFAMSLGAFALVAAEFMPVSLLTPVATDLHISEGQAGQAISVSGLFALITSLCIAALARRCDRRLLLAALTGLMIVSASITACATSYPLFMLGRAFIGVAIGGFWSLSAAIAMRLVPDEQVPKALAIVNGGNALATVIAAPLGSLLGAMLGWRIAFFCVVPLAAIALVWILFSFPALPGNPGPQGRSKVSLLKRPAVALGMLAVSLFFMGQFSLFTYLRPFLETVTLVGPGTLSGMLLILGIGGFIGTYLIGSVLRNGLRGILVVIPFIMAVLAVALIIWGKNTSVVAVLLAAWGLVGTSAPVAWWTWLARTLPDDAESGGGLLVALVQLAIASGAIVGGMLFDSLGYRATFGASAAILLVAAAIAAMAGRASHHSAEAV